MIDDRRFLELLDARARRPELIEQAAAARKRRPLLADDGRTCIIAGDHPARAALQVGSEPLAMARQRDLPGTVATLEGCARAVSELAARKLVAMVEPLPACREANGTVRISQEPDELERVLEATTLPTLLLGGDPPDRTAAEVFEGWKRALRIPQVRGLVAGRALLYPPASDVAGAVGAAARLVHG